MRSHIGRNAGVFLAVGCSLLLPLSLHAERRQPRAGGGVAVQVRALQAMQPREEAAIHDGAASDVECDERIADLRGKLAKLHFRKFKLISDENVVVPVTRKQAIGLNGGETLIVRPLYVEKERIGMYLDWQDKQGKSILNTRMHFVPGESVLTGTDHSSNSGVILAIDVKPE